MSILEGATNVAILGGTQVAAGAGSTVTINRVGLTGASSAFKDLSAAAAHAALHDSAARFDAPRCPRNTRVKFLDKLELWMLGQGGEYEGKRLIWLTGGAGAGKSAIMQSIVERNYAEVLIPTPAYQLARMFPTAMAILEPIISCDPLIFKTSLHTQAYELLVRPILYLVDTGAMEKSTAFVIDGLDECSDPLKQALIISAVSSILCEHHLPVLFVIASRPEPAISSAFLRESRVQEGLPSINLDDDYDPPSDILCFVQDSFFDIVNTQPMRNHIAADWPSSQAIDDLTWKSTGHFIYAATVMKFIASPDEHPPRALQVVEGLEPSRTTSPFAHLDALHLHILTSAKYSQQFLAILRHCIFTMLDYTAVTAICCMHNNSPLDFSSRMHVVLKHASLADFLNDEKRSQAIYTSREEYMASGLTRYLQLLDNGPQVPSSLYPLRGGDHCLLHDLAKAIRHSQDAHLLWSLINGHSPQDIWNFCVESFPPDTLTSRTHIRDLTTRSICEYMRAIRDSIANHDNALYIRHFKKYIQVILDDLNEFVHRKPQYQVIPALLFSSNLSGLALLYHLLFYFGHRFRLGGSYAYHFFYLYSKPMWLIDPRSFEALKHSPQSQIS
ncbi:hypothetical protein D9619_004693 [Psilocybe cf. subviscida]|uniref:NACHT domain-containing protein n=1 Tax=Psilocybe cf. subviscida TaxID=2480587 RepID=A0A8H5BQB7_9AGAR|nr:hypothetical protein D9619_004693 [Psilocybe cf. subviscida]